MNRLLAIRNMIIPGETAADIGSDHALLPIYLIQEQLVPRMIATEVIDGPYKRAQQAIKNSSCLDRIELRKGDGLQVIGAGEVSSVIIAGMGGETIADILAYDWRKSSSFKRFIMQPMSRAYILREVLSQQGWPIIEEQLAMDKNRIFVIICSRPGHIPYHLSRLEMDIGPLMLRSSSNLRSSYLEQWMNKYTAIYNNLLNTDSPAGKEQMFDYKSRIEELEAVQNAGKS